MSKEIILGIDLGTTNSCFAFVEENGTGKVIANRFGANTTASVIAFDKSGQRLVGVVAKRQPPSENTFYETKRLIGRRFDEVAELRKHLSYKVVAADNGDAWVEARGEKYSPSQIASMILLAIKEDAETYLGKKISKAVITVPAYFNDAQRQATKDAGAIAGLEVVRIINEPTAAALAYGLDKNNAGKTVIFDLGGGTFDVSVLDIDNGVFEVLATNGDTMLGGGDFDEKIIEFLLDKYQSENGVKLDLKNDKMILPRLKEAAEKAKIELSNATVSEINLPYISADGQGPKHLNVTLTRAQLEKMCQELIARTIEPCKKALADANVTDRTKINDVVLVGGMTRMPKVIEAVREFFGKEPHRGVNPDEVVAIGAAIQGAILAGNDKMNDIVLLDVTPLNLGIETQGGVMSAIIPSNTTIPTKKSQVYSTAVDMQTQVHIKIFQGDRAMAADNKVLGEFVLDGIVSAPRGIPQIEVIFDMDSNGILHVSAKDKGTGKEHSVRIASDGGLSKEEIARMQKEAKLYEEEDKKRKELIEKRNHAESLINTVEKGLSEHGDKLSAEEKTSIEESLKRMHDVINTEDIAILNAAIDDLSKNSMKLGEIIYKQSNKAAESDESKSDVAPEEPQVAE